MGSRPFTLSPACSSATGRRRSAVSSRREAVRVPVELEIEELELYQDVTRLHPAGYNQARAEEQCRRIRDGDLPEDAREQFACHLPEPQAASRQLTKELKPH